LNKGYALKRHFPQGAAASSAILRQRPQRPRSFNRPRQLALVHRWRSNAYLFEPAGFRQYVAVDNRVGSPGPPSSHSLQAELCFPTDPTPDFATLEAGVLVQICEVPGLRDRDDAAFNGAATSGVRRDDECFELSAVEANRLP
jgi:hypothetical protein